MNTQKKQGKTQLQYKDCGDMRRHAREVSPSIPRDRGDVRRKLVKKPSTHELIKGRTKTESIKTDLISRSTNTFSDSLPLSFENQTRVDVEPKKCLDFRERIRKRYTFKLPKANVDSLKQSDNVMESDKKNKLPTYSYSEYSKQKHKDFENAKKPDVASVHRAVSAIKIKATSKSSEVRKRSETEKAGRKEKKRIKIALKSDAPAHKVVTFEGQQPRRLLQAKPTRDGNTRSKLPGCENQYPARRQQLPRTKCVVRKRSTRQSSPSLKSAETLPTEIASWVPESINQHTQPYYEAWVSKTATASTKLVKEARLVKSKMLRSLELNRKSSPDLLYRKYADEQYAGRIRVRRRGE